VANTLEPTGRPVLTVGSSAFWGVANVADVSEERSAPPIVRVEVKAKQVESSAHAHNTVKYTSKKAKLSQYSTN
jgi:hypothetical protein